MDPPNPTTIQQARNSLRPVQRTGCRDMSQSPKNSSQQQENSFTKNNQLLLENEQVQVVQVQEKPQIIEPPPKSKVALMKEELDKKQQEQDNIKKKQTYRSPYPNKIEQKQQPPVVPATETTVAPATEISYLDNDEWMKKKQENAKADQVSQPEQNDIQYQPTLTVAQLKEQFNKKNPPKQLTVPQTTEIKTVPQEPIKNSPRKLPKPSHWGVPIKKNDFIEIDNKTDINRDTNESKDLQKPEKTIQDDDNSWPIKRVSIKNVDILKSIHPKITDSINNKDKTSVNITNQGQEREISMNQITQRMVNQDYQSEQAKTQLKSAVMEKAFLKKSNSIIEDALTQLKPVVMQKSVLIRSNTLIEEAKTQLKPVEMEKSVFNRKNTLIEEIEQAKTQLKPIQKQESKDMKMLSQLDLIMKNRRDCQANQKLYQEKDIIAAVHQIKQKQYDQVNQKKINYTEKQTNKAALSIQKNYKGWIKRKQYKSLKKNSNYRRCVYGELTKTEEDYVKALELVLQHVIVPARKILSQYQITACFSNIESIHIVNSDFLSKIKAITWHPNAKLCQPFLDFGPYFKIYFEYFNKFESMRKNIDQFLKEDARYVLLFFVQLNSFKDIVTMGMRNKEFKGLDLQSFLIKPIQRLPKYTLLLKDLLKHTAKNHQDYDNIAKSLDLIEMVNIQNNKHLQRIINGYKFVELQKLVVDLKDFQVLIKQYVQKLVNPKRTYLGEEPINIQIKQIPQSVIAYFMNDMIIISENRWSYMVLSTTECYLTHIFLDQNSFIYKIVKPQNESHTYYTISGVNQTILFMSENEIQYQSTINLIQPSIDDMRANLKQKVEAKKLKFYDIQVELQGVQQRPDLSVIYMFEASLDGMTMSIQLKLDDVYKLQNLILRQFPKIKLPMVPQYKMNSDRIDPKIIQFRGVQIQNLILNLLSSSSMFQGSPKVHKILGALGLTKRFYMDRSNDGQQNRMSIDGEIVSERCSLANIETEEDVVLCIICSHNRIQVKINEDSTGRELIIKIAMMLGLKEFDDFKLVSCGDNARIVQDEEVVGNIFKENSKGMMNWVKSMLTDENTNRLQFTKCLTFSRDNERSRYTNDPVRLEMLCAQIIEDVKIGKYTMSTLEVTEILTPQLCSDTFQGKSIQINTKFVSSLIDHNQYNYIERRSIKSLLIDEYPVLLQQISNKNSDVGEQISIARHQLIYRISKNRFYGMSLFEAQVTKNNKFLTKDVPQLVIIGVRFDNVIIMNRKRESKLSIDYQDIEKVFSIGDLVYIQKEDKKTYEFQCLLAFTIQMMCAEYKEINESL